MVSFLYVMSHFFDHLTLCSVLVCLNMSKRHQQLKTLSIVFFLLARGTLSWVPSLDVPNFLFLYKTCMKFLEFEVKWRGFFSLLTSTYLPF